MTRLAIRSVVVNLLRCSAMSDRPARDTPKDRLIAAAATTFHRFGYRRTTVEDITKAAGIGKGSLYLHFTSKKQAYLAVVESRLRESRLVAREPNSIRTRIELRPPRIHHTL